MTGMQHDHCATTNTIVQWPWDDTHAPITCARDPSRVEDQHHGIEQTDPRSRRHTTGHTSPDLIDSPGEHCLGPAVVVWSSGEKWRQQDDHARLSGQTTVPIRIETAPAGTTRDRGLPVLSAGPTPHTPLADWTFALEAEDGTQILSWSWEEFRALGPTEVTVDIHCVTRWSKFDTDWRGISVDRIFAAAGLDEPPSPFVMAFCDGGYSTNCRRRICWKALVVWEYDGEPLEPEHGGPARLLVPHLYFWKSAKWVRGLRFMEDNEPGFWEVNGYHSYGDPSREQRYDGD
jgi:DMSO/TMAO reductase YedYZ molybdopterin-dependent catalytic subunit